MRHLLHAIALFMLSFWTDGHARPPSPFPVEPFALPFRPVALAADYAALRYQPAGLGTGSDAELAWLHHFTRRGPGGNNALFLRLKSAAFSVSWIEDRLFGNRREYFVGFGGALGPNVFVGSAYRYIKADREGLQNSSTWTYSLLYQSRASWSLGLRWENPFDAAALGVRRDGVIVSGVTVRPWGPRAAFSADWSYPEKARMGDTRLTLSAHLQAASGIDLAAFADTEDRIGLELRFLVERSAAGVETRFTDPGGYRDGTLYISVLQREYDNARPPKRGTRR